MSRTFLSASTPGDEGNERIRLCIPSSDAQLSLMSHMTFLEPSLQQQSQVLQQEPISIRCLKSSLEEVQGVFCFQFNQVFQQLRLHMCLFDQPCLATQLYRFHAL